MTSATLAKILLGQRRAGDQSTAADWAEDAVESHAFPFGVNCTSRISVDWPATTHGSSKGCRNARPSSSAIFAGGAALGNFLAVALAVIGQHDRSTGSTRQLHLPLGASQA